MKYKFDREETNERKLTRLTCSVSHTILSVGLERLRNTRKENQNKPPVVPTLGKNIIRPFLKLVTRDIIIELPRLRISGESRRKTK